jgi:hypothetical protein
VFAAVWRACKVASWLIPAVSMHMMHHGFRGWSDSLRWCEPESLRGRGVASQPGRKLGNQSGLPRSLGRSARLTTHWLSLSGSTTTQRATHARVSWWLLSLSDDRRLAEYGTLLRPCGRAMLLCKAAFWQAAREAGATTHMSPAIIRTQPQVVHKQHCLEQLTGRLTRQD